MNDQAARLNRIRERLQSLASLAAQGNSAEADRLIAEINTELDALDGKPRSTASHSTPRTTGDAIRCPRCTIRGFRKVIGEARPSASGNGDEARFYCSICCYDSWVNL